MPKNNNSNTDQIRQLDNRVHLAGALAELSDINEGNTTAGIPYISFNGAIQCGADAVYTVRFRSFVKSKKSDGTDSKNYAKIKEWVKNAVPMTKNKDNPTMVDMIGSLTDNPYVNASGNLVESTQFNVQLFGDFKDYAAEIDLEGFVHSIVDETKGADSDETTGRQRMRLITRDIFRNTLDIKNIIVPQELVRPLRDNDYDRGCTAKFFITLMPNAAPAPVKSGGIGTQRTSGANYLEWVMTGADPVISAESDKALDSKLIKDAMTERKSHLDEIKEAGYQGGNSSNNSSNNSSSSSSSRNGIGTSSSMSNASPITEDEEFPF
jgi:hypothetical protein